MFAVPDNAIKAGLYELNVQIFWIHQQQHWLLSGHRSTSSRRDTELDKCGEIYKISGW